MKKLFAVLIVLILAFGCVEGPVNGNGNETNVTPQKGPVVEYGDNISVDYILWVDGAVYDTSIKEVANESGIYDPRRTYKPFEFQVLFDHGVISGFVSSVVGMEINETKGVSIPPEYGYGEYNPVLHYMIPKYYNKSMIESVPVSYFEERNISFSNGTVFDTEYGTVFVNDFNDTHVELAYIMDEGELFTVNGLPQRVVGLYNLTYMIEYYVTENRTYYALSPMTSKPAMIKVVNISEDYITFDENHALAGKTLEYEITLINMTKTSGQ